MRAIVKKKFNDLKEGVPREVGSTFVLSKDRFDEIEEKLPGFLEKVETKK